MLSNEIAALPKGWKIASLGDVIELKYGKGLTKSSRDSGRYAVYGSNGVVGTHSNFLIENSCLLVGRKGSIGEVHVSKEPCWAIDTTYYIDKFYEQPIEFWFHRLKALPLGQLDRASAIPGLNREDAYKLPIALPPLNEQRRIVAKIEALKARSQKVKEALEAIPLLLDQFRRSVVNAAFRGDLSANWREDNPDVETAVELLERIQKDKESFLEKHQQLSSVQHEDLLPLPDKWLWTVTENLSTFESNAICAGPFGTIFKANDFRDSGIPIIFLRHVGKGKYLTNKPGFMDVEKWEELFKPYSVWGGELLVTKLGEPPGVCAIYPESIGPAMVTPDVIKMSVNKNAAETPYLMYYFNSDLSKRFAFGIAYGITRLRMNLPIFRTLPIPLAPIEEQKEIVHRIQSFFKAADRIEQQYREAKTFLDQLDQSILAKAFRGELVPQDPNDEPASVLLERIQAERTKREAEAKATQKSAGKTTGQRSRKAKQEDSESIQLGLSGLE